MTVPADTDAEADLLAAMAINEEAAHEGARLVREEWFYVPAHRVIFRHIIAQVAMLALCTTTLRDAGDTEAWDTAGCDEALLAIICRVGRTWLVASYAEAIEKAWRLRVLADACKEAQQLALAGGPTAWEDSVEAATRGMDTVLDLSSAKDEGTPETVDRVLAMVTEAQENRGAVELPFGLPKLDRITHGLKGKKLYVLAGRPGAGKTAFGGMVALRLAMHGHGVLFVSLEMDRDELTGRWLSSLSGVNGAALFRGELTPPHLAALREAGERFRTLPLYIEDKTSITPHALSMMARRYKRKHNIRVVVVDYLQLMKGGHGFSPKDRTQEVAFISHSLKALAKNLDIPVIALAQLNRDADKERPRMSNLRESGAIEQDADLIALLWHMEDETPRQDYWSVINVEIAKHRGGPTHSNYQLDFDKPHYLFHERVA